jgi:hypothetical protein
MQNTDYAANARSCSKRRGFFCYHGAWSIARCAPPASKVGCRRRGSRTPSGSPGPPLCCPRRLGLATPIRARRHPGTALAAGGNGRRVADSQRIGCLASHRRCLVRNRRLGSRCPGNSRNQASPPQTGISRVLTFPMCRTGGIASCVHAADGAMSGVAILPTSARSA